MTPVFQDSTLTVYQGNALEVLKALPDETHQCCVTSPPYWSLRDYGVAGQIGLERTFAEYLSKVVAVFDQVRRVIRNNGVIWVNMGDSMKDKELLGQPWRVAFALQDAGWYLRSDIIWHKLNPMPESCTDRPTKAHEYIFLLTKSDRYFYDADAIREPVTGGAHARGDGVNPKAKWKTPDGWDTSKGDGGHGSFHRNGREKGKTPGKNSRIHVDRDPAHQRAKPSRQNESFSAAVKSLVSDRNKRSVWSVATAPYREAHFATYPPDLIKPCILAGSRQGDTVLDPFGGSGTTARVAIELGRKATLIELNPEYLPLIQKRTHVTPGLPL